MSTRWRWSCLLCLVLSGCPTATREPIADARKKELIQQPARDSDGTAALKLLMREKGDPAHTWQIHRFQNLPWEKTELSVKYARIEHMEFSPDGKILVISGPNGIVEFWDPLQDKSTKTFLPTGKYVPSVARVFFSRSTRHYVVANSFGDPNSVYDADSGKELFKLSPSDGGYSFSPNGKMLARATAADIEIIGMPEGTLRVKPFPPTRHGNTAALHFATDEDLFVNRTFVGGGAPAGSDSELEIWRISDGLNMKAKVAQFSGQEYSPKRLKSVVARGYFFYRLSDDGSHVYGKRTADLRKLAAFQFEMPRFCDWRLDQVVAQLDVNKNMPASVHLLSAVKLVVVGEDRGLVHFFDFPTGEKRHSFQAVKKDSIRHIELSPDGGVLAVATYSKVFLWDVKKLLPPRSSP